MHPKHTWHHWEAAQPSLDPLSSSPNQIRFIKCKTNDSFLFSLKRRKLTENFERRICRHRLIAGHSIYPQTLHLRYRTFNWERVGRKVKMPTAKSESSVAFYKSDIKMPEETLLLSVLLRVTLSPYQPVCYTVQTFGSCWNTLFQLVSLFTLNWLKRDRIYYCKHAK